jgi:hypothetical protein
MGYKRLIKAYEVEGIEVGCNKVAIMTCAFQSEGPHISAYRAKKSIIVVIVKLWESRFRYGL